MPTSTTRIQTQSASKYLQQLCKHWSHKLDVTFTPQDGTVIFDAGRKAHFMADGNLLSITVTTDDRETLTRTQNTVINHLKRFAFREDLGEAEWQAEA